MRRGLLSASIWSAEKSYLFLFYHLLFSTDHFLKIHSSLILVFPVVALLFLCICY